MTVRIHAINFGSATSRNNENSGDAILIENNGLWGMIDAGGCSSQVIADQYGSQPVSVNTAADGNKIAPFLRSKGVKQLEWLVMTHFHSDHAWWAWQILNEFKPKMVYGFDPIAMGNPLAPVEAKTNADSFYATATFIKMFKEELAAQGKPFYNPTEKQVIKLGDAAFTFYNTDAAKNGSLIAIDYNYASLVLVMTYGASKVAFMSDSRHETMNSVVPTIGKVDMVFAAHHGVIHNTSELIASTLKPSITFLTKWRDWYKETIAHVYQYLGSRLVHFNGDWTTPLIAELDGTTITVLSGHEDKIKNDWFKWQSEWYYFDANGAVAKGWALIGGGWYMFNSIYGNMRKGWYQDVNSTEWYYLSPSLTTVGGVTFKEGQMMYTTWIQGANGWYWLQTDGKMARNTTITIGGKPYTFDATGVCLNP